MSVPSVTINYDNLYTSTIYNRRKEIVDNIFNNTPFLNLLKRKGAIQFDGTGGEYLEAPLAYGKNGTVKSFGRADTFSLTDTHFLSMAKYKWKYVGGSVVRYFTDDAENKDKQAIFKLVDSKVKNLEMSISDELEIMLFSDGTGNSSKDIEGLGNLVDDSPTSSLSVGNINQSTYSWWRNQQKTSSGGASLCLRADMRTLFNDCSKGSGAGMPDAIVTDQTSYELYEDETLEQKQIVTNGTGGTGDTDFPKLLFKGVEMVWSPQATSGYMYFLNTKFIGLVLDPSLSFEMTEWKPMPNGVDRVAQMVTKLNFVTTRRSSQGVLTGIAA